MALLGTEGTRGESSPRTTDAGLIAALARRDEAALSALIDAYGRPVYGKALHILGEPRLAEDVARDTLLLLWRKPHRFEETKGTLRAFLMGVARFKAIDVARREGRVRSKASLLGEAAAFFQSSGADRGVEDAIALRSAVSKLPLAKQEVIFLAYYKGLTYREVADLLDVPERTVKTRIRDSLIKLRTVEARPETP